MANRAEIEYGPASLASSKALTATFAVREVCPLALFYALYAVGAYLTVWLEEAHVIATRSDLVLYLTSPFGSVENLQSGGTAWSCGIFENFLMVAAIMVLVVVYRLFLSSRSSGILSLPSVFLAAIASTYLVSLGVWVGTGTPTSGTSIIAFSLVGYLFLACVRETWEAAKGTALVGRAGIALDVVLWTGPTAIVILLSLCYLVGNESAPFHLGGAVLTGAILLAASLTGSD